MTYKVIAQYLPPKQRCTIHYGYAMVLTNGKVDVQKFEQGTNHLLTYKTCDTMEEAWRTFHAYIQDNMQYGPGTWEDKQ